MAPTVADEDVGVAIDFMELMREEKRRAKEAKKEAKKAAKGDEKAAHCDAEKSPDWPHDCMMVGLLPAVDIEQHRVQSDIDALYYIDDFLKEPFETDLVRWLQALPRNVMDSSQTAASNSNGRWTAMKYAKRRVALFEETTFPAPLQQLVDLFVEYGIFPAENPPNHVLVNEYQDGQGIMPHTDGPLYLDRTATLSLGKSNVLFKFFPKLGTNEIGSKKKQLVQEVLLSGFGSLVVFSKDAYTNHLHTIDESMSEVASNKCVNAKEGTRVERGYRISLTFRHKFATSS